MNKIAILAPALFLALTGCPGDIPPQSPGEKVVTQTVEKEVPMPCPVTQPDRPTPLVKPLPTDLGALVDALSAKLEEWAGKGRYGDQASHTIDTCIHPVMIGHPTAVVPH